MKTLFALALSLTTFASAQAAPLLQAHRTPGFEMNPQSRDFSLEDTGRLTLTVKDFRKNETKVIELGQLSKYAVNAITAKIAQIDARLPLKDPKEGDPMCTDTPGYSTSVFIRGQAKEVSRSSGCHEWSIESYEAKDLVAFASQFLNM